jgi:hypothetical protein
MRRLQFASAKQLALCKAFGTTASPDATPREAARLIDEAKIAQVGALLRRSGFRRGCILRRTYDGALFVLVNTKRIDFGIVRLDGPKNYYLEERIDFYFADDGRLVPRELRFTFVANGPEGWIHSLAAVWQRASESKERKAIRTFVEARLAADERQQTEHGEFWLASRVEELAREFAAATVRA